MHPINQQLFMALTWMAERTSRSGFRVELVCLVEVFARPGMNLAHHSNLTSFGVVNIPAILV